MLNIFMFCKKTTTLVNLCKYLFSDLLLKFFMFIIVSNINGKICIMRKYLNLKRMLLIGFSMIAFVIIGNGIYGFKSASINLENIKEVSEKGLPRNQQISLLMDDLSTYRMSVIKSLQTNYYSLNMNAENDQLTVMKSIRTSVDALKMMNLSTRATTEVNEIENKLQEWFLSIKDLRQKVESNQELLRLLAENENQKYASLMTAVKAFNNRMDQLVLDRTTEIYNSMVTARATRNISLAIPVILALLIGMVIQYDIKKNMKRQLFNLKNGNEQNLSAIMNKI